jgi:hypothetical protein
VPAQVEVDRRLRFRVREIEQVSQERDGDPEPDGLARRAVVLAVERTKQLFVDQREALLAKLLGPGLLQAAALAIGHLIFGVPQTPLGGALTEHRVIILSHAEFV